MKPAVVLVHGIWMNGMDMSLLRKRLNDSGFNTHQFTYHSLRNSPAENAIDLKVFSEKINAKTIHYVGHSLGGLVIRHLLSYSPDPRTGRIVTLGTPHHPSSAAMRLRGFALGRMLLGRSTIRGLAGDLPPWNSNYELGVIAGNQRFGAGMLIPGIPKPSDGTVSVAETRLEQMTDHCVLPVTHTGMLFSKEAARQIVCFLLNGKFCR